MWGDVTTDFPSQESELVKMYRLFPIKTAMRAMDLKFRNLLKSKSTFHLDHLSISISILN